MLRNPAKSSTLKPKILLAGVSAAIFFDRVSLLEITLLTYFIYHFTSKLPLTFASQFSRVGLLFLSSFFLLFSDIINNSSVDRMVKGVGAYALVPVSVICLATIFSYKDLWLTYFISKIASFFADPKNITTFSQESFKFTYSSLFIVLILSIFSYWPLRSKLSKSSDSINLIVAVFIALISIWGELRLATLVIFAAWLLSFLSQQKKYILFKEQFASPIVTAFFMPLFLILLSLLLSLIAFISVGSLHQLSILNSQQYEKTYSQLVGGLGLLFGGRTEVFPSILAWLDKPLFGWGSWAIDPNNHYLLKGQQLMTQLGYDVNIGKLIANITADQYSRDFFIPTHSALFNTLVWGGLLAFIPTLVFFATYLSRFFGVVIYSINPIPLYVSFSFSASVWAFLFSPLGFTNRIDLSLLVSIVISYSLSMSSKRSLN